MESVNKGPGKRVSRSRRCSRNRSREVLDVIDGADEMGLSMVVGKMRSRENVNFTLESDGSRKRGENRKEEPKKVEQKKVEPKKVEPKKVEPKKEEQKKMPKSTSESPEKPLENPKKPQKTTFGLFQCFGKK